VSPDPQVATGGATQVNNLGFDIPTNVKGRTMEQENIVRRLQVTTDPSKVLWIHLIALDGSIIRRMPVTSKVTSSGKRLEPRTADSSTEFGADFPGFRMGDNVYETNEFLQADGTFGDSDAYIYWFDPMGRYHQWGTAGGLGYLLTDYPIDLQNPQDVVTGLYNMDVAAYDWQIIQEAKLCKTEGGVFNKEKGECSK